MNRKERFYATIERKPVDRPASWLGLPVMDALPALFKQFKASTYNELKEKVGDDIYPTEVPYNHPPLNHIACAFDFAKSVASSNEERTLTAPGFFEDYTDPTKIDEFAWPDPSDHINPGACKKAVNEAPQDYALMGIMWSALGGSLWYFQFFFYGLGHVRMGNFMFASWVIHMSMLIFFSYIVGLIMKEWRSVSRGTYITLIIALLTLIISFVVMTYGSVQGV